MNFQNYNYNYENYEKQLYDVFSIWKTRMLPGFEPQNIQYTQRHYKM